jgi:hypothetical protein
MGACPGEGPDHTRGIAAVNGMPPWEPHVYTSLDFCRATQPRKHCTVSARP